MRPLPLPHIRHPMYHNWCNFCVCRERVIRYCFKFLGWCFLSTMSLIIVWKIHVRIKRAFFFVSCGSWREEGEGGGTSHVL